MSPLRTLDQSSKLKDVLYEIRGQALVEADRLENEGHTILKLNTGNPAVFGFEAPFQIVRDMIEAVPHAHGYSDSRGIMSARRAVVYRYEQDPTFPPFGPGRRVPRQRRLRAHHDGDAGAPRRGRRGAHPGPGLSALDRDDEPRRRHAGALPRPMSSNGWQPDLEDIRAKVTPRTKAIVVINPNNPTGAVYSREVLEGIAEIARENSLLLLSDEIYDRILFDDAQHIPMASVAPDLLCLTFNGLSKTYRVAGYRSGWLVITGPKAHAAGFLEGITLLASTRLCPNVPAQHAVQAALSGVQSIDALIAPTGRLHEQRDAAWESLEAIPGVSCVKPQGALYAFPRFDPDVYEIRDDAKFVYDFLVAEHVLLVQGTGFNWATPDHVRIVTLPEARVLSEAIERLGNFLASYKQ